MPLSSFVLVGTILSHDPVLATVEFDLNPATNGGPAIAVIPVEAIPCEVRVNGKVYIVKQESDDVPTISCEKTDEKN
tara:strand:+ start:1132 stop:1362 length:231 start_codon:yes stop_codon:yes gene_type:complete